MFAIMMRARVARVDLSVIEIESSVMLPGIMDPDVSKMGWKGVASTRSLNGKGNHVSSCARSDETLMSHSGDRSRSRDIHVTAAQYCTNQCQGTFSKSAPMQKPVGQRASIAPEHPSNPMTLPGEQNEYYIECRALNAEVITSKKRISEQQHYIENLVSGWTEEQERVACVMQHDRQTTSELLVKSEKLEELTRQFHTEWKQRQTIHSEWQLSRRTEHSNMLEVNKELAAQRLQLEEARGELQSARQQRQELQSEYQAANRIAHTETHRLNTEWSEDRELIAQLRKKLEETKSELHSTQQQNYSIQTQLQTSIHINKQENDHLRAKVSEFEQNMAEDKVSHEARQVQCHHHRQETEMLINELRQKNVRLQSSAEHHSEEAEQKDGIIKNLFERNQRLISLRATYQQERTEMSDAVTEMKGSLDKLSARLGRPLL